MVPDNCHCPLIPGKGFATSSCSTSMDTDLIKTPWPNYLSARSKRRKPFVSTTENSCRSSRNCLQLTTTSQSITPSAAFRPASCTVIASGTHPRAYKSCTNYLRSTSGLRSSINARLNLRGSPRTLRSPAEPRLGQRSQTPAETTATINRCTT
jgi:hypothetical protein